VKKHCQELIDSAGRDGGYILSCGAVLDEAKPENLKMMLDTAKVYGKY
jgi:uroporphyrinogen-III decarboxylase